MLHSYYYLILFENCIIKTKQGIIPYFYYSIHKGQEEILNRCIYNCMVDNPYRPHTEICLDKQPKCQDCRLQKYANVKSAHFTICQKPWTCTAHVNPKNMILCEQLHNGWFNLRDELEQYMGMDTSYRVVKDYLKRFNGMCKNYGDNHYLPIPIATTTKPFNQ